jgi:integrase
MSESKDHHYGVYVDLMGQSLAPTTHSKYSKALSLFEAYCDHHGLLVQSDRDVDRHLAHYIQLLYNSGQSQDLAKNTVYGVQHHSPWLAHQLGASKLALRGWKRAHPSTSHPPLTWELTCLMATWMAIHDQHDAALAMIVGFDCYLRIGELLSLTLKDVAISNDPRLGSAYQGVLLRLAHTKTGPNQAVTVENGDVSRLLTRHIGLRQAAKSSPDSLVFKVSRHSFYSIFHGACKAFNLDGHNYSPHSLRHGGATRAFLLNKPFSDIKFRGRWSNSKSVRTYIQSGRALLLLTHVPKEVFEVGASCSRLIRPLLIWLQHSSYRPTIPSSNAYAEALRAGWMTSEDRKVQGRQAS